ncbi:hypothetical protein D3C76_103650 [compost metagenome]
MDPAIATRAEIRDYVRTKGEILLAFAQEGGNVHQKSLDQQDEVTALIADLSDEEKVRFLNIYTEEVNARAAQLEQDSNKLFADAARVESERNQVGSTIAGVIVVVAVLLILWKLSQ